jgi:hypothetical protein
LWDPFPHRPPAEPRSLNGLKGAEAQLAPADQAPAALNALAAHDTVLQTVPSGKAATISADAEPIDRPMSLWLRAGQPGDT